MAVLRMFASAREAAGTGRAEFAAATVGEVLAAAVDAYGERFAGVLAASKVWLNGEPVHPDTPIRDGDEVAILPPVSGGCR